MLGIEYVSTVDGRGEQIFLVPIGDTHIGTRNCNEEKLQATIDWIKRTKNAYWIGMGDYGEFINYSDPRFDPSEITDYFKQHLSNLHFAQAEYVAKMFDSVANKCVGLIEGNHEQTIKKHYHMCLTDYLAVQLHTRNLTYTAMVRWLIRRKNINGGAQTVVIYASHGFGVAASDGMAINRLMQQSKGFDADIFLMGHVHRRVCNSANRLFMSSRGEPRILSSKKIYGVTGAFLSCYDNATECYAETKGVLPTSTGTLKITIEPFVQCGKDCHGKSPYELPPKLFISDLEV